MAHFWVAQDGEQGPEWALLPLLAGRYLLASDPALPARIGSAQEMEDAAAVVLTAPPEGRDWVLLCRPDGCRVNGEPVAPGIRALRDRDAIQVKRGPRLFFSTETQAQRVPFPGSAQAATCPRCLQEIAPGQPTVFCPGCRVAYHEDDAAGLLCWTYGPCAFCGQPGVLEAGFRWTPEEL